MSTTPLLSHWLCISCLLVACRGDTRSSKSGAPQLEKRGGTSKPIVRNGLRLEAPASFVDVSAKYGDVNRFPIILQREGAALDEMPMIAVQRSGALGGTFAAPDVCREAAHSIAQSESVAFDRLVGVDSTSIVEGPIGPTCQFRLRDNGRQRIVTELAPPDNSPSAPRDVYLMACGFYNDDSAGESTCAQVLQSFRFVSATDAPRAP